MSSNYRSASSARAYPPAAEATIEAPIDQVFDTLLDGSSYPEWNPLILEERGDSRRVGEPLTMTVRLRLSLGSGLGLGVFTVHPTRTTVHLHEPRLAGEQAEWVHRYASLPARLGLVCSERHHELLALGSATTGYRTYEHFWGPLSYLLPYASIDAGFKAQTRALKERCEGS